MYGENMQIGLDFKDIVLTPNVISTIPSRNGIDISSKIGSLKLTIPIIASPMKDVCNGYVQKTMHDIGAMGVLHRFSTVEEQVKEYNYGYAAIGINGDYIDRFNALYDKGCRYFLLDVANCQNIIVKQALEELLKIHSVEFIIGNISSEQCFKEIQYWPGVVGLRVGVASGSACTTKNSTGVYTPMVSLINACQKIRTTQVAIIADGGIKEASDFCKAIAVGADAIILGGEIAKTTDSPAELIQQDGKYYKIYHGSASFAIQKIYKEIPRYIEGEQRLLPYNKETISSLIQRYSDGIQSSMSYFNARNIDQFHKNANWTIVH